VDLCCLIHVSLPNEVKRCFQTNKQTKNGRSQESGGVSLPGSVLAVDYSYLDF